MGRVPDDVVAEEVDGRTARRDRNRDAVLDAAIDLFREDAVFPGPARVAERSGVSRRSVQRYFDDMDALLRAAMARHLERVGPLFEVDGLGEGGLDDRVARLVDARLRLYAAIAPMARAAVVRAHSNVRIRERLAEARQQQLEQAEAMFAPELGPLPATSRRELVAAVDVLLGLEALERLLHDRGLPRAVVRRSLIGAVAAVVRAAA